MIGDIAVANHYPLNEYQVHITLTNFPVNQTVNQATLQKMPNHETLHQIRLYFVILGLSLSISTMIHLDFYDGGVPSLPIF